jgi:Arylsulfotransferase (ASST)
VALSALMIAGFLGAGAEAGAAPSSRLARFSTPGLFPKYRPSIHDYVVRCNGEPMRVQGRAYGGWKMAIGNHRFRRGRSIQRVTLRPRRAFVVKVRKAKRAYVYRYHVRCLPSKFPDYNFTRYGPVSPKYFAADRDYVPADRHYGIIFDNHGVPVWWIHASTHALTVLPNGNVLWFDRSSRRWEVHRLDGSLVRTMDAVGPRADVHDLQVLDGGGYLFGAYVPQSHVDTSAHGGSSDATVINTQLLEVSPSNQIVWDWKSQDHVALAETGRHWPWSLNNGYDIAHWNSIEEAGDSVIASFRHFDAVYKIRKSTGEIVWKLGGTTTPRSLTVEQDSFANPLGAQHDARLLSDGTLTVFDNRTKLGVNVPRAVRFGIDEASGTATLLESISDPAVPTSDCCGSARRLSNGDWLIAWGKNGPNTGLIGGYEPDGRRTFLLRFDAGFSYRAQPVRADVLSAPDLRKGMTEMAGSGGG